MNKPANMKLYKERLAIRRWPRKIHSCLECITAVLLLAF